MHLSLLQRIVVGDVQCVNWIFVWGTVPSTCIRLAKSVDVSCIVSFSVLFCLIRRLFWNSFKKILCFILANIFPRRQVYNSTCPKFYVQS